MITNKNNFESTVCKWYYQPFWVWVLILSIGPLALPFLIKSPRFNRISKILISLILCIVTTYFVYSGYQTYKIMNDPEALRSILEEHFTAEEMELLEAFIQ